MAQYTRSLATTALLLVVAILIAACGGAGDSGTGAATPTLEPVPADVLARQMAAYVGPVGTLQAAGETLERPVNAEGITQAVDMTGGDPPCPGYVDVAPSYVFDLTTSLAMLRISFVGTDLSTLMVVTPQGKDIVCTGVEGQEIAVAPSIELPQPEQGRYMVYVGRANLSGANNGRLTVTGQ